mmetsp:Transcript_3002/g.4567  ORF Transcript_3002/g.4567 Transcript_3002/m.4567 type:complete len:482 (-) Transcript_3002:48-1493(-)
MDLTLRLFIVSLAAMVKIFLVSLTGVVCAKYPSSDPLLQTQALRHLSRISTYVLVPCLITTSIGYNLSVGLLMQYGVLIPACMMTIGVSYAFGYILKFIHEDNPKLYASSFATVGSPNIIALPIIVMQSLCEESTVNADYHDDPQECSQVANSMMFIYAIGFSLIFWSYGTSTLASLNDYDESSTRARTRSRSRSGSLEGIEFYRKTALKMYSILQQPSLLGIYAGLFVGLIPSLGDLLFHKFSVLRPMGGALMVLASPVVCLSMLIMSASLAHINVDWSVILKDIKNKVLSPSIEMTSINDDENQSSHSDPNVLAIDESQLCLSNGVRRSDAGTEAASGYMDVVATGEDGTTVAQLTPSEDLDSENSFSVDSSKQIDSMPQWRSVIFIILCRTVLPPIIVLPVLFMCVKAGVIGESHRLLQLLIIVEAGSPPANMVIVVLNQLGFHSVASKVSYTYVFTYLFSIISITIWATIGMRMIYF